MWRYTRLLVSICRQPCDAPVLGFHAATWLACKDGTALHRPLLASMAVRSLSYTSCPADDAAAAASSARKQQQQRDPRFEPLSPDNVKWFKALLGEAGVVTDPDRLAPHNRFDRRNGEEKEEAPQEQAA